MHCIKDILEIAYYVSFIILTYKIYTNARKTYELEASRQYELLCKLSIREETTGGTIFGYALEVYNAGNKVAKSIDVEIQGKHLTTIDFVKPGSSAFFPLGHVGIMQVDNKSLSDNEIMVEKNNPLNVRLLVDGRSLEYEMNTDVIFATRDNNTGTLKGIEDKLAGIEKAIDTEYQRNVHGDSLIHVK